MAPQAEGTTRVPKSMQVTSNSVNVRTDEEHKLTALAFSAVRGQRKTVAVRVGVHRRPSWDTEVFKPATLKV